jgi:hypothetical protein
MKSSTLLLTFLFLGGGELRAADDDHDVVLRALSDELRRSMERLRLEKNAGPYYLEYAVEGTDNYEVAASFGALSGRSRRRNRNLSVDLRVGDYSLDNTNFGGGEFGFGALLGMAGDFGESVTTDDDYDALRHEVWLKTDAAYKSAIEELEAKKAYLQENTVQDRPDDLSREEPVVSVEPASSRRCSGNSRGCRSPWSCSSPRARTAGSSIARDSRTGAARSNVGSSCWLKARPTTA